MHYSINDAAKALSVLAVRHWMRDEREEAVRKIEQIVRLGDAFYPMLYENNHIVRLRNLLDGFGESRISDLDGDIALKTTGES